MALCNMVISSHDGWTLLLLYKAHESITSIKNKTRCYDTLSQQLFVSFSYQSMSIALFGCNRLVLIKMTHYLLSDITYLAGSLVQHQRGHRSFNSLHEQGRKNLGDTGWIW